MASSMIPELQKTFENTWAYEMNQQLKEMFQAKARKECLDVVKSLMACKQKPKASICAFVLEMKGYVDRLESLNMVFDAELSINIILSGSKLCFYCNTNGHWKRTCPKYLKDLKEGKVKKGGHSGSKGSRRLSGRVSKPPQFYYGFYIEEDKISDSTLSELDEPANYKEAMASLEATKWKEAMKS
ncbi:retrotransposon protein, putative, ty1-copia subclass [Tanacetum coccineum]